MKNHKWFLLTVLILLVIGGGLVWYVKTIEKEIGEEAKLVKPVVKVQDQNQNTTPIDVSNTNPSCIPPETLPNDAMQQPQENHASYFSNGTYINNKYGFKISVPEGWTVGEFDDQVLPRFVVYQDIVNDRFGNTMPDIWGNRAFISINPNGISGNFAGTPISSGIDFFEKPSTAYDYIIQNGSPWMTIANFKNKQTNWSSDGNILGQIPIANKKLICFHSGELKDPSQCTGDDTASYSGTTNHKDRKTIEKILSNFKFIQ